MLDALCSPHWLVVKRDKGNTYWARFLASRNHSPPQSSSLSSLDHLMPVHIAFSHPAPLPQSHISSSFNFSLEIFVNVEKSRWKRDNRKYRSRKIGVLAKTNFDIKENLSEVVIILNVLNFCSYINIIEKQLIIVFKMWKEL